MVTNCIRVRTVLLMDTAPGRAHSAPSFAESARAHAPATSEWRAAAPLVVVQPSGEPASRCNVASLDASNGLAEVVSQHCSVARVCKPTSGCAWAVHGACARNAHLDTEPPALPISMLLLCAGRRCRRRSCCTPARRVRREATPHRGHRAVRRRGPRRRSRRSRRSSPAAATSGNRAPRSFPSCPRSARRRAAHVRRLLSVTRGAQRLRISSRPGRRRMVSRRPMVFVCILYTAHTLTARVGGARTGELG